MKKLFTIALLAISAQSFGQFFKPSEKVIKTYSRCLNPNCLALHEDIRFDIDTVTVLKTKNDITGTTMVNEKVRDFHFRKTGLEISTNITKEQAKWLIEYLKKEFEL